MYSFHNLYGKSFTFGVCLGNFSFLFTSAVQQTWLIKWLNQVLKILHSCLFVAEPSFNYLMLLYFLYQYCRRLEEADYQGKPADMAYMLMVLFSTTSEFLKFVSK